MNELATRVLPLDRPARRRAQSGHTCVPDDVLRESAQRLARLCAAGAGIWIVELVVANVVQPAGLAAAFPWPGNLVAGTMIAILAASFVYVRVRAERDSCATLDLGLVLLVLNALAIAAINEWPPRPAGSRPLSWNTLLILLYAMAAPTSPRAMFAGCVAAASADPLALAAASFLSGSTGPGVAEGVLLYYPNYVCAVAAVLPSLAQRRLGRKISHARELGSYELVERLAHGGMGEVWRAEHRLLARPAAIKLVRPEMLGAADAGEARALLRRFEREAQATAVLTSPHTINLFDFGLTRDGAFYYVMELLLGRDLESLIRGFGALPTERVGYLLRQICHSLAEAHARGLVHRDVKPANVYVCRMGLEYDFVKVLDFGLVHFSVQRSAGTLLTADQATSGTPAYMAPEVILGESAVDARADVYSLGCLAYWMLTGRLVFDAATPMRMLMHHVETPPVPPSRRTELPIPPEWDRFVLACLEKDPQRRPKDAGALLDMIPAGSWTRAAARGWWESNLPDLTQPLVLAVPAAPAPADRPRLAVAAR